MLAAMTFAMLLQGQSAAAPPRQGKLEVVKQNALQRALGGSLAVHYPAGAQREWLAGKVTIDCGTTATGVLEDCRIESEDPAGAGFGAATLSLARLLRAPLLDPNGSPIVGERVRAPILFRLPGAFETKPKRLRHPSFSAAEVHLDCRFKGPRLDNCITIRVSPANTPMEAMARQVVESMDMASQRQNVGRIVIPLLFTPEGLPQPTSPP